MLKKNSLSIVQESIPQDFPEDQEQLFTRFYRVKQATFGDTRGIGLGLYVAKAIVDAHQGEILVQSEIDVGSTFSVILPVHQAEGII